MTNVQHSSLPKKYQLLKVPIVFYLWIVEKFWTSGHMMNCCIHRRCINKLWNPNLERSMHMQSNQMKEPFQYEKIPLDTINIKKERKAKNTVGTIKRVWSYLARERVKLLLVIFMVMISSAMALLGPFMIGMAVDEFIVTRQSSGLLTLIIWLFIIYALHSLSIFLQNFWMVGIAQNTVYSLRKDLFHQFHRLPISYFDKRQHGELMSRDRKSTRLNSSHVAISYAVFCLKKKNHRITVRQMTDRV